MQEIVFPFLGGLGLFLIGMMLMSQGLVAFGGDVLKQSLSRFTGTPATAVLSGALGTMVIQSSSATTVTMIGFVSAGLISFSQAIGVLIGASLGNTATGWIVAGLGLKVHLGFYTLPLIGLGALVKLMAQGRAAELGLAMAGFGLMFLGLDTLQDGMRGLAGVFNLASLPSGGYGASVLIMLFGLALTGVLQSSTAAIATTLTALHTHTINFDQAAALVVGAAIGTTFTGALVTIGGTLHAKRTAVAYILFNAVAGVMAIALLPVLFWAIDWLGTHAGLQPGAMSLAAFHTLFIALGVMVFLPVLPQFAHVVERLLPDRDDSLTQRLDDSMLTLPSVALEASQRTLERTADQMLAVYGDLLTRHDTTSVPARLQALGPSLDRTYSFVSRIEVPPGDAHATAQRIAQLHAIDHSLRFRTRLDDLVHADVDLTTPDYEWARAHSHAILTLARQGLAEHCLADRLPELQTHAIGLSERSSQMRDALLNHATPPSSDAADLLAKADAFRWLERTGHHIWRISHYLSAGRSTGGAAGGSSGRTA